MTVRELMKKSDYTKAEIRYITSEMLYIPRVVVESKYKDTVVLGMRGFTVNGKTTLTVQLCAKSFLAQNEPEEETCELVGFVFKHSDGTYGLWQTDFSEEDNNIVEDVFMRNSHRGCSIRGTGDMRICEAF